MKISDVGDLSEWFQAVIPLLSICQTYGGVGIRKETMYIE